MARDTVTFRVDGEVTVAMLRDALDRFQLVLTQLESDHSAQVKWVVSGLEAGSAEASALAVPLDEGSTARVPAMVGDYLAAARSLSDGHVVGGRPLLRVVRGLAELTDADHRVTLETEEDEVVFVRPPDPVPGPSPLLKTTKSLGSVRGRVETLSHRQGLRFTLYELSSDRAVRCFLQAGREDQMRDVWGRIADVSGLVTRDAETGIPQSVRQIEEIDVVDEGDPLGYRQARGVLRGLDPSEVVIRRIRDAG